MKVIYGRFYSSFLIFDWLLAVVFGCKSSVLEYRPGGVSRNSLDGWVYVVLCTNNILSPPAHSYNAHWPSLRIPCPRL
ncbi:hypothetical protein I7I48_06956 [Histoplasma ohiense]|nr:hypothetical protein I7I48_06956 [Histoplasma ohiense (nom. inval.)]